MRSRKHTKIYLRHSSTNVKVVCAGGVRSQCRGPAGCRSSTVTTNSRQHVLPLPRTRRPTHHQHLHPLLHWRRQPPADRLYHLVVHCRSGQSHLPNPCRWSYHLWYLFVLPALRSNPYSLNSSTPLKDLHSYLPSNQPHPNAPRRTPDRYCLSCPNLIGNILQQLSSGRMQVLQAICLLSLLHTLWNRG